MKVIENFFYEGIKEKDRKWAHFIDQIQIEKTNDASPPEMTLKFFSSREGFREELESLASLLQFNINFSNDSGESPYNAVLQFQQEKNSIKFIGNLLQVIGKLKGNIMMEAHVLKINESTSAKKIIDESSSWYITLEGKLDKAKENTRLYGSRPTNGTVVKVSDNCAGTFKRKREETMEFSHVMSFQKNTQ